MCKAEERAYTRPIEVSSYSPKGQTIVRSYRTGRTIWARCDVHGSNAPRVVERIEPGYGHIFEALPVCPVCSAPSKLVAIETPHKRTGKPTECNRACLAGKRSCSCRCGGRCHGAGICQCNQAPQLALI